MSLSIFCLSLLAGLVPVLALPIRYSEEDGDDDGREHLEVVAVHAQGQDDLDDQIVDDCAQCDCEQLECEIAENAAEDNLTDDD